MLRISLSHLKSRVLDRLLLKKQFCISGAKFVHKQGGLQEDPDFAMFKTSLPQIEIEKKLVLNVEKEFSEKTYDIKVFDLNIKSLKLAKKYRLEMFWIEQPHVIFRADYYSEKH